MALHESALEELGLAPIWVRRGSANAQTAPEVGEGGATADVVLAQDAVPAQAQANPSPDAARVERAPDVAGAVRGDVRAAAGFEAGAEARRLNASSSDADADAAAGARKLASPAERNMPRESASQNESPDTGRRPVAARLEPAPAAAQSAPPDDDFAWFDE